MDQLFAAFGINGKLLLAQLVNFGVLFVGLTYLLYKPVMKTLDERKQLVAQGVEDAKEATLKLATADDEAQSRVHEAETEAEGIVGTARESAGQERARIIKEAEARAASLEKDAEARAKEDAARVLRESEKEIARLSVLAAEKVLRTK
jgi:F-type H+-transporting ATPase subunit b